MSKPTEIIVLCEDYRQSSFMLAYLKACGINRGVRPILSPQGRGSAEQWVRAQYSIQVNAYRIARAKKHTWLVVVVDADTGSVAHRLGQMDSELMQAEDPRLRELNLEQELIARLVPRRNIETWILALNLSQVDELQDYKKTRSPEAWFSLIPSASLALYNWTRLNARLPEDLTDSLRRGIQELGRIDRLARSVHG